MRKLELSDREIITLGIIAQHEIMTAFDLTKELQLSSNDKAVDWIGSLVEKNILKIRGKTKGTKYFINPILIKDFKLGVSTLKTIPPHRLKALILHDLERYGQSRISEIHDRIGKEIAIRSVRIQLGNLLAENQIEKTGIKKGTTYQAKTSIKY